MPIDPSILTRPLQGIDTSPLWQVAALKEQRKIRQEDKARQDRIDQMNAETALLQQKRLRKEIEMMGQSEKGKQQIQALVGAGASVGSAMEVLVAAEEAGAPLDQGPPGQEQFTAISDFDRTIKRAKASLAGTRWAGTFENIDVLVHARDYERAVNEISGVMAEAGVAKPFMAEYAAIQDFQEVMGGEAGGVPENANPLHVLNPKTGQLESYYNTSSGPVDLRGNPYEIPEGATVAAESASVSAAKPGDLSSSLKVDLRDQMATVASLNATIGDAIDMIDETPDINAWAGRMASVANDIRVNAASIMDRFGLGVEGGGAVEDLLATGTYEDTWRDLGIENEEFKSIVTGLAFQAAAASGQRGRDVSERDVRMFIQQVGGSTSDPIAIKNNLGRLAREATRRFEIRAAAQEFEYDFDLGLGDVTGKLSITPDSQQSSIDFSQMSDEDVLSVNPNTLNTQSELDAFLDRLGRIQ